ncbi:hypothetical protein RADP37_05562 [Roseomonas mucosa]|uniref:Uncharacterized protein n=1 Tax=Roseomonas mucosa TaxID=207340 RepID=A0A4Y1MVY4_9PROT|nr:hypothetical protein RADP37_05562 [Roseomonas mucosa]
MPDRAGEHGSPADCLCRQRGDGVYFFSVAPPSHLLPGIRPRDNVHRRRQLKPGDRLRSPAQ